MTIMVVRFYDLTMSYGALTPKHYNDKGWVVITKHFKHINIVEKMLKSDEMGSHLSKGSIIAFFTTPRIDRSIIISIFLGVIFTRLSQVKQKLKSHDNFCYYFFLNLYF